MAACEKCWSDANRRCPSDAPAEYRRLLEESRDSPCTPEEQCGEMHLVLEWTDSAPMCRCEHAKLEVKP